jgi:hypothetical protein
MIEISVRVCGTHSSTVVFEKQKDDAEYRKRGLWFLLEML